MAMPQFSRCIKVRLAVFALSSLLTAFPGLAAAQMGGPALVEVAVARVKDMASETLVPGTVISRSDARLSAEVDGRLMRVADVGTVLARGEVVAEIEATALQLQMAELEAEVTRAEARLRFLESEERRFEKLAQSNLAAITQLEQTQSDRDVARGDLQVAKARLEQTADRLARTRIRAPFDGVVVERLMTPGERAVEGSNVVRLVDQQHLEVVARAPLEYLAYVSPGQLLNISAAGRAALAEVRTVVAVGDENTHQFELRLDLEGSPFPVGKTLRVAVPTSDSREVLTVPRDALVLRPEGHSVFVVDANNEARQVSVTVGTGQGDDIEVLGEVAAGDRVVIRGNERLRPGQAVTVLDG
jgi:RND family efflux transporter MFP subunit